MLTFYLLLILLFRAYGAVVYAKPGNNVTLRCSLASSANYLCWYKQAAGEPPQIIFYFYKHSPDSITFNKNITDKKRFSLHSGEGFYHLNISNVQDSDSAMYYCGQISVSVTEFNKGTFLVIQGSSRMSVLQEPESNSVQPGGSVTLNCTVFPATSEAELRVYWFKKESGNSHLGILYTHSQSGHQCVSFGSPARSCVYSLSKRNVTLFDSGMYYCAVASCGEIVFGKGMRLDVGGKQCYTVPVLVHGVVAALAVSLVVNIILACIFCKMAKRKYLQTEGLKPQQSPPEYTPDCQNEDSTAVQYVSLDFKKKQGTSRRQRDTEEETIYSGVRPSDLE